MFAKRSLHIYYAGAALAGAMFCLLAGSPSHAQPVGQVVSGYDPAGTKTHPLNVDSQGRLNVIGSASGGSVFGADAPNTTATQSPVRVGGCSLPLTNTCTVRNWVIDANGFGTVNINGVPAVSQSGSWTVNQGGTWTVQQGTPPWSVGGSVANGGVNSGNPVKIGGVYNSSGPTYTTGTIGDLQMSIHGILGTVICDATSTIGGNTCASVWNAGADGRSNTNSGEQVFNYPSLYNNSTWDRWYSVSGLSQPSNGTGIAATANTPNNTTGAAIVPVVSTTVQNALVFKPSAGNLYRVRITTGAVAGYLLMFNATTTPPDGAVTPQSCTAVPANATTEIDHQIPDRYSVGITAVFSTTGCFTKTASATAMFEGSVE